MNNATPYTPAQAEAIDAHHVATGCSDRHVQSVIESLQATVAELAALARRVARLNPDAGEIGPGMLASLVGQARIAVRDYEYVMTPKARGVTREYFHAIGWTDEQLVREGYMK